VNAAFLAAGENRPIAMEDVLRAARRELAKLEKPTAAVALARAGGVR
jgi:hypothetical protein